MRTGSGTPSYEIGTAVSPSSTLPERALVHHPVEAPAPGRAPAPSASTRRGRSRDGGMETAVRVTATCAPLTAPSPVLMLQTRAQDRPPRAPRPLATPKSTRRARLRDFTLTPAMCFTASCALLTVRLTS